MSSPLQTTLHLWVDGQRHVVRSLADAIEVVRSVRHPLTDYSELLVDQIEAAISPDLQLRAWRAVATWLDALRATAHHATLEAA
ncbi:hypothetical protein GCM10007301_04280 [Azorhizobium oxalatiphilum]|uniref:Uncharacterized protein n=1 Tax=Azorhizobium oxalatiphilum TaxID=980631 RepID=A0A917BJA6_9HYPH|nr:hypothetical protein [Azorhizobium oxalatiphilum]GGF48111.1 hypothetical protein GCM10007301_04280 [Azorhizobium oxalatiphilum]